MVGAFVGIKVDVGFATFEFVACTAIWLESPDVGAYELLKWFHLCRMLVWVLFGEGCDTVGHGLLVGVEAFCLCH